MASSFTYATLKAFIKEGVEDEGADFDANVDTIIKIGEDRVLKDMPLSLFDGRANVSLVAGNQTPNKPAGCIVAHEITYTSGGETVILYPRRYSYLRAVVRNSTQATPKYFADDYPDLTQFWLAPNPNVTLTAEALMCKRPDSIVTANATWLGTNVGDVLLASCMIAAERFNLGWDEMKNWGADYTRLLASARVEFAAFLRLPYLGG